MWWIHSCIWKHSSLLVQIQFSVFCILLLIWDPSYTQEKWDKRYWPHPGRWNPRLSFKPAEWSGQGWDQWAVIMTYMVTVFQIAYSFKSMLSNITVTEYCLCTKHKPNSMWHWACHLSSLGFFGSVLNNKLDEVWIFIRTISMGVEGVVCSDIFEDKQLGQFQVRKQTKEFLVLCSTNCTQLDLACPSHLVSPRGFLPYWLTHWWRWGWCFAYTSQHSRVSCPSDLSGVVQDGLCRTSRVHPKISKVRGRSNPVLALSALPVWEARKQNIWPGLWRLH